METEANKNDFVVEVPLVGRPGQVSLSPIDQVITYFGYWLLILLSLVLLFLVVDWWFHSPQSLAMNRTGAPDLKATIDTVKALSDMQWDRASKLFDLLVLKGILPTFSLIVGYLIGKKAAGS